MAALSLSISHKRTHIHTVGFPKQAFPFQSRRRGGPFGRSLCGGAASAIAMDFSALVVVVVVVMMKFRYSIRETRMELTIA